MIRLPEWALRYEAEAEPRTRRRRSSAAQMMRRMSLSTAPHEHTLRRSSIQRQSAPPQLTMEQMEYYASLDPVAAARAATAMAAGETFRPSPPQARAPRRRGSTAGSSPLSDAGASATAPPAAAWKAAGASGDDGKPPRFFRSRVHPE